MARIALVLDGELSHYLQTFALAQDIESHGHEVLYCGFPSAAEYVRSRGYTFVSVFSGVVPASTTSAENAVVVSRLFGSLLKGEQDAALNGHVPDAFLTLSVFCTMALVLRYRFQKPVVLLRSHCAELRRREEMHRMLSGELAFLTGHLSGLMRLIDAPRMSIDEIVARVLEMPEIVIYPASFFPPELREDKNLYYARNSGNHGPAEQRFSWEAFDPTRPIVYCSLGTRPDLGGRLSQEFHKCVIETFARQQSLQLIMSTGKTRVTQAVRRATGNVYVSDWVPQTEVLKRSDLVITHGGMGTVRECITAGVPMLVVPMIRDQFASARRVIDLGIGVQGDIRTMTSGRLSDLIASVLNEKCYKSRVMELRANFLDEKTPDVFEILQRVLELQDPGELGGVIMGGS
jgi:MGT family glycosyltransferase